MKENWVPIDIQDQVIIDQREIFDAAKVNRERVAQATRQPMILDSVSGNPLGYHQREGVRLYRISPEKQKGRRRK